MIEDKDKELIDKFAALTEVIFVEVEQFDVITVPISGDWSAEQAVMYVKWIEGFLLHKGIKFGAVMGLYGTQHMQILRNKED